MKKIFIILFIMMLLIIFSVQVFAVDNLHIISIPYKNNSRTIDIEIKVPVIIGMEDKTIQEKINKKLRENIFNFAFDLEKKANDFYEDVKVRDIPFRKYVAMADFEVTNKIKILSFIVKYYQYTAGAHGLTIWSSYNIDRLTGKELSLEDFLTLTNLDLKEVHNQIKSKIDEKSGYYFSSDMAYKYLSKNQDYYIKDDKLVVYFQQYEIAPYVAGLPEFKINFSFQ